MKIAVFGYYNALNAGDDRIQFCITRLLQGHTVVFLPHHLSPPIEYLRTFDWILIGGGGLVFERVGIWMNAQQWIRKCNARIGILGLGVNQVTEELKPELSVILNEAQFVYVRDETSRRLLNHPKVQVLPDITWCYPISTDRPSDEQGVALNLVPCHWKTFDHKAWIEACDGLELHPFPFHFGKNRDANLLAQLLKCPVLSEFSLSPLLQSQLVVACRYHAIVFAMQIGKPFIAIYYDDKVKRLLDESNLTECGLETTESYRLREKIDFVLSNQAQIKEKITQYAVQQAEQAGLMKTSVEHHLSKTAVRTLPNHLVSLKSKVKQVLGGNQA